MDFLGGPSNLIANASTNVGTKDQVNPGGPSLLFFDNQVSWYRTQH